MLASRKEEFAGESAKWSHYQSPHFELFSANHDDESRDLLHNLELLRALFFDNLKLKEHQPLNVTVYYFDDKEDFFPYVDARMRQNQNLAGYYLSQPDRAIIVISPAWDDTQARHVIFHEYIHHLIRVSGETPPLWYNEGVAELYSSIEIGTKSLELGKPLPWHIQSLRSQQLLPLATLFAVDQSSPIYNTGTHTGQFYAESWALLHFWYFGSTKFNHDKIAAFMNYIRNETPGADPVLRRKLFQQATGMDYPAMQDLLESYARDGSYVWKKLPLPQIPDVETYARQPMTPDEARQQLAELDLRVNQSGKARLVLLREADQVPVKARTLEVLGTDALAQGDEDLAQARWNRALEIGTDNPAIYHELGQMESRRWFGNFDYYFQLPAERAGQLRALLKRSIQYAPDQTDAYEMLAWVEGTVVKPDIANVNLVQKRFATLTHKGPTLAALAMVRVHLRDRAGALQMVDLAEATKPGPALAVVIAAIRSHLKADDSGGDPQKIEPASESAVTASPGPTEPQNGNSR